MFRSTIRSRGLRAAASTLLGALLLTSAAGASPADLTVAEVPSHTVLATVQHGERTYEFVRSTEGGILGVAEIAPAGTPSLLASALQGASPTEVFAAVADPGQPPGALALGQRGHPSPRLDLAVSPATRAGGTTDSPGIEHCAYDLFAQPGNSQFAADWYWNLGQYQDFSYQETHQWAWESIDFTEGHHWYLDHSTQRWLGACNGTAHISGIRFYAQARGLNGEWFTAYERIIGEGNQVIYTSFSPGNPEWRLKLKMGAVSIDRDFSVAGAGIRPITDITWQAPRGGGHDDPGPAGIATREPARDRITIR